LQWIFFFATSRDHLPTPKGGLRHKRTSSLN